MEKARKVLCLFDVDGTLTIPRGVVKRNMIDTLKQLQQHVDVAIVGGSDLKKIEEQLTPEVLDFVDYTFSENGLKAFKKRELIGEKSIKDFLGEDKLKGFLNFCLKYMAGIDIPIKRGTFIEYRTGMINVSPIGRNCSQSERDDFEKYDHMHNIRKQFIEALRQQFPDIGLAYSIGGQISFDVFPIGWNKCYCLQFVTQYEQIHFFGDKTFPGGNDYEIYEEIKKQSEKQAHSVKSPEETIALLKELFIDKHATQ